MVQTKTISFSGTRLKGVVGLPASKSISNRVLIIRALSGVSFPIGHLSDAQDTETMDQILHEFAQGKTEFNVGHAGTTFRFLTAFLATKAGSQILTGSARMRQRPIGPLVEALRQIGADIDYLGEEGFPPLCINAPQFIDNQRVRIYAGMSSQFLSALLLVGPYLPKGLILEPEGKMVSSSYLKMTMDLMRQFGAEVEEGEGAIYVKLGSYRPPVPKESGSAENIFEVESDWSAASYFLGISVGVDEVDLFLPRLYEDSLQGDQAIAGLASKFGVGHEYVDGGLRIFKEATGEEDLLDIDFLEFPDLAQTVIVMAAIAGKTGFFTGLETLKIKETDRIHALQTELKKVGISFRQLPPKFSPHSKKTFYTVNGVLDLAQVPTFATYEDHRMAMALAMLATKSSLQIENPSVVKKSFPKYWEVLQGLGFTV